MRLPRFLTALFPLGKTLDAVEQGAAVLEEEAQRRNDQLTVSTATEGLPLWERDYALSSEGDEAVRRNRVRTAMQGEQTLTPARLRRLAVSLAGADSGEVSEDFPGYTVTLTARYEGRAPEDIAPLREAVGRLRPAHLKVEVAAIMCLAGEQARYSGQHGSTFLHLTSEEGGTTA